MTWCLLTSAEEIRWGTSFGESYFCQARSKPVAFQVRLPPGVDRVKAYPLIVTLKGGLKFTANNELPFIEVNPTEGGIWGYRTMSAYDVMEVISYMKKSYPVDPDRIYLVGFSAGASGAMHLASIYPDQFAAVIPLVAMGNNYPLENFRNLPVMVHHGDKDWTSSICNARVQYQKLKGMGCPVILKEYKDVGHSVPGSHEPIVKWLLEQKRNPVPRTISHRCESATQGHCYWLSIREFQDPHQAAEVDASIEKGVVTVLPVNIVALSLNLKILPEVSSIKIGDTVFSEALSGDELKIRYRNDQWEKETDHVAPAGQRRGYHSGAAANLYQGEPLLIVYGTARTETTEQLRVAAENLAFCGGPVSGRLKVRFPVIPDTALTAKQESTCNLILVGTPEENLITKNVFPRLPILIRNEQLEVGERPSLPLRNQVVSLIFPNPNNPDRLVYLLAPYTDHDGLTRFANSPQHFLCGSTGFDRISAADLVVQNPVRQIAREMQFDKDWKWIARPGSERKLPPDFANRNHLAKCYLEVMREKSGADFAFWWGPADQGMWGADFNFLNNWNPAFYTEADYGTQHRRVETMTAILSEEEIEQIWNRWGRNRELTFVPGFPIADAKEKQSSYRVIIPMDLYIKLGQRKKNLADPSPGPIVTAEEIRDKLFPGK